MALPRVEVKKKEKSVNAYRIFGMEAELHPNKTECHLHGYWEVNSPSNIQSITQHSEGVSKLI